MELEFKICKTGQNSKYSCFENLRVSMAILKKLLLIMQL